MVEEIFKSENLEKLKREIKSLLEEEILLKLRDCTKAVDAKVSQKKEGAATDMLGK